MKRLILLFLIISIIPALSWAEDDQHEPQVDHHNQTEAEESEHHSPLPGDELGSPWAFPFAGILLSIAILPLIAPTFWHHNFGKVSAFWALLLLIPMLIKFNAGIVTFELLHTMLLEFFPFIILLLALFTISGGIRLTGTLVGTPVLNTGLILIGTVLASWMGTTGAAMLMIRPLLRANAQRKHKVHVVVFFIFLVANIGGSLTPLGDPPLFLGFLKGVDFFWTTGTMFVPMMFVIMLVIIIFYLLDSYYYKKEVIPEQVISPEEKKLGIEGSFNFLLLIGVIASVLLSGFWKSGTIIPIYHLMNNGHEFHLNMDLQNLARDLLLLALTFASWKLTPMKLREANDFSWFPIQEVGKLFAGIFITIIPAIAILRAGESGALKSIIESVSSGGNPVNYMYFWATGILSSFLDNAPTYLVFFNTAGGDAAKLMGDMPNTLLAISAGAVFMGANTYIGNAPNFMVKSIAEQSGIKMPSFFGYMLKYSIPVLIPIFILVSLIFF